MKYLSFFLLFVCFNMKGQSLQNSPFVFDQKFYDAVDHWVIFPPADGEEFFRLGFIYIDETAGFTFHYEDEVQVRDGKIFKLETHDPNQQMLKARLSAQTRNLHILNENQVRQLSLPEFPEWLKIYKEGADTDEYQINIASFYNSVGAMENALEILNPIYARNKENTKLLFELVFSYNALQRFEEAKNVVEPAIQKNPDNILLYKEAVFSYVNLGNLDTAEQTFADYIKNCKDQRYQPEMAFNIAHAYFMNGNRKQFDLWKERVFKNSNSNPAMINYLKQMEKSGFKEN